MPRKKSKPIAEFIETQKDATAPESTPAEPAATEKPAGVPAETAVSGLEAEQVSAAGQPKPEKGKYTRLANLTRDSAAGVTLTDEEPNFRFVIRFDAKPEPEELRKQVNAALHRAGFEYKSKDRHWEHGYTVKDERRGEYNHKGNVKRRADRAVSEVTKLLREAKGIEAYSGYEGYGR